MPAARAYRPSSFQNPCRDMWPPRGVTKKSDECRVPSSFWRADEICGESIAGALPDGNDALLAALATHPDHARVRIDGADRQGDQLGYAQAARIQQLQHRLVARPRRVAGIRLCQQPIDLVDGEKVRQRA